VINAEEAGALRRSSMYPDVQSGEWDEERDERLYQPLVRRGLLRCEVRPHPTDPDYEIVHYETTDEGLQELRAFDVRMARMN
jgi:hypothetical protein